MSSNIMHPSLSQLLPLDKIPNEIEAVRDALISVFDDIYVKNLIVGKSYHGDSGFYSLTLTTYNSLGIDIPIADDLKLVLNPTVEGTTEIPISFDYSWVIIKYIKEFSLGSFDNAVESVLNILFDLAEITPDILLREAIYAFYPEADFLTSFVNDFNNSYTQAIEVSNDPNLTDNEKIESLFEDIEDLNLDVVNIIFESFIEIDLEDGLNRLKKLFAKYFDNIEENIKKAIQLNFNLVIRELSVGLQFPHKWLRPVYTADLPPITGIVIDDPLPDEFFSYLKFNAGSIEYSSESGFQFNQLSSFELNRSMIGTTGLLAEFSGLKIDLKSDKNIPEATADGRPDNFKGVYADYAAITFPKKWFDGGDNHPGTTARLAGYNLLIGTGGISGTISLEAIQTGAGQVSAYYDDCFSFQYPIELTSNSVTSQINTYGELIIYLNNLNGTSYNLEFPLTTILADGTVNPVMNAEEYSDLLVSCTGNEVSFRLVKKIGGNGFEIWFTSFDITFQQGHIVESNIQGGLKIPRLKDANGDIANIDIFGHLDDDGGFNVTASEQDGFQPIIIPNVLDLYINSLEVGRESDDAPFYIGTACDIVFTNEIIKKFLGDQRIVVERLRIYSDGSFEIVGGTISVPTNFSMVLIGTKEKPVLEISISGIHFGSFQEEHNDVMRKYNYFGFDGAISLGLKGFDGRGGAGVKYFYTVDDASAVGNQGDDDYIPAKEHHSYIKIETIEVDLTIPGTASGESATAIIKGWLSINEVEYAGGVSLELPRLKMAGGADMRLQPKPPAFLIDAYLDIPIPIPLAATGLGITGFRGLLGFRYVAEKEAVGLHSHDDTWYDYYTYPPRGIHVSKFNGPDKTENYTNPISLGAGVTVATMGSNDVISLRVMVLLSIPNMLMIDGRASILSKEWGLDDSGEPPFFAFMILADNGIEIGAGVDFKLPQNSGSIIDLHVYMQAGFFWDNPSGWYLNMGTREDPITAKVLSLVEMESFLMLSGSGIEAGAKVSFDIEERFGPIKVKAWFLAEVGGFISFERPQIGGYMTVDAGARVDLFGIITVGVSFYVHFSVEAAKPFLIYAEIRVCGRIKLLFVRIKICATVKIKWEKSRQVDKTPIPPITEVLRDQAVKGIHMLTGETFELINFGDSAPDANSDHLFNDAIIPLDTYVDIKFEKALLPGDIASIIGSYNNPPENYEDVMPPVKVIKGNELRQVKHRYQITDITIQAAENGSNTWVDYHPYEAVVKGDNLSAEEYAEIGELRIGHWQKSSKEYNAIRLLANSPFSYTEQGEPGWFVPEQIGLTPSSFFCSAEIKKSDCVNWLHSPLDTNYHTKTNFPYHHTHQNVFFNISQGQTSSVNGIVMNSVAKVVDDSNIFDFPQSLKFPNTSALEFKFPKPSKEVTLKLSTNAQGIKVTYYKSFIPEGSFLTEYVSIDSKEFTPSDLTNQEGVTYTSEDAAISKIKIYPIHADQSEIDAIYEQIEALFNETYEELQNEIPQGANIEEPLNTAEYYRLLDELKILQKKGCYTTIPIEGIGNMQIQSDNYDERVFEVGKTPIVAKNSDKIYCQIYNEIDNDGIDEYRFRVYNFDCKIILSSSTRYYSKEAAISEMEIAVNNILSNDESILIKQTINGKWYFNIIDETNEIIARRIKYFTERQDCLNEINDLKTILQNNDILITEDSCVEKDNTSLIIDDSCDPCSLHEVLLNHYNNCFVDNIDDTTCFDEFIELLTNCGKNTKPVITGITFPYGNCCQEAVVIVDSPPVITGITFPFGNCCQEAVVIVDSPPVITGITFPFGNCCQEAVVVVDSPPVITGITFPFGNCCREGVVIVDSPPVITAITFPTGNCCEVTLTNGLAVTLFEGTCYTQNSGSSFTYYVSNYNIQNGDIIYVDVLLTIPLNLSPNQKYYFGGTSGVLKRSFSIGLNGVVSNMSLCTTNDYKTALQVDNCDNYSGQSYSVSVTGDGKTIGNQVFIGNTLNLFNGNNNWYRFSSSANTQIVHPDLNDLDITSYIVKIDTTGTITQISECL
ncbi:hypothetical protein [Kordia sp.]|uniref:hypothetical protein n=1 Tax=Kordia sp. TaxID=1965332 RepID=UPI003D2A16EB